MQCPTCTHDNRDGARFCLMCGTALQHACAACRAPLPPAARFCDQCGTAVASAAPPVPAPGTYTPRHLADKILTLRSALEGERKQVTVLFADITGSLDLAEHVDAETWHRILDGFFAIVSAGIHRFEGTINQYTGDGVMALFGAPLAHEDHAQRACHAVLQLRPELRRYSEDLKRQHGLRFSVRMGLNSGEVVVGKIGDDLRMDYTAQGHTVGLAARMEQLAEPGTAYLTASTARLVGGFFALRDLGTFTVKGVSDPVRVYELHGPGALRTRFEAARARGLSRFVGREAESAGLDAALERAIGGRGEVVGIVAEAGVGKSRLCFEFAARCRARGIEVNTATALPHGRSIPFLPLLDLLRSFCGISSRDTAAEGRTKVAGTLLLRDESFKDDLPFLFEFLGVADPQQRPARIDPDARQRRLFSIVQRLIRTRGYGAPAVLIFEDLHWIDGASQAALDHLIEYIPATPTLVVLNYRPEYQPRWLQAPWYSQIALVPLAQRAMAQIIEEFLGTAPELAGLAARLQGRAAGNPFFLEELIRSLLDDGILVATSPPGTAAHAVLRVQRPVGELEIPATVQAVLSARIDRLADADKRVLQLAAVIGNEFTEAILTALIAELGNNEPPVELPVALETLLTGGFVQLDTPYPEAAFSFRHPLTHEVAYRAQLSDRRARLHAAAAAAIARTAGDAVDERAALLAHHWEQAGNPLEAARWARRAAEWVGYSDAAEALQHWRRVHAYLAQVARTPAVDALDLTACMQLLSLGLRTGLPAADAAAAFDAGQALAAALHDDGALARLFSSYGAVRAMAGETHAASALLAEAERKADRSADPALRTALRIPMIVWQFNAGRLPYIAQLIEEAIRLSGADPRLGADITGFSPYIFLVLHRGIVRIGAGELALARADLDAASTLAIEHGETELQGMAHGAYALLALHTGVADDALEHAHRAIEIAEDIGSTLSRSQAYEMLGIAHLVHQNYGAALEALQRSIAIARERQTGLLLEAGGLALLSDAYLHLGDVEQALRAAADAVHMARERGSVMFEADAQLSTARALLRGHGPAAATAIEEALQAAEQLIRDTGARSRVPLLHVTRAQVFATCGDDAAAHRELERAAAAYTANGADVLAARVRDLQPARRARTG